MIGSIFKDTSSRQFKRKGDIFLHIANQVRTPATRVKKTKDIRINKSKTWSWEKLFWTFYTKIAIHKQPLGNNLTLNKKTNFDFWHCSSPTEQTWNYSVCPSWLCPCRKWAKLQPQRSIPDSHAWGLFNNVLPTTTKVKPTANHSEDKYHKW